MYSKRKVHELVGKTGQTDVPGAREIEAGLSQLKFGISRLHQPDKYVINAYTVTGLLNAVHPRTCWDLDTVSRNETDPAPRVWHMPARSLSTMLVEDLLPYKLHGFNTYFIPASVVRKQYKDIHISDSALDTDYIMLTASGQVSI